MAKDTATLLRQIGVSHADFFRYSMGGQIALHVARLHPDLVRSVIFPVGGSYDPTGFYPEVRERLNNLKAEILAGCSFPKEYAAVALHPENWSVLVEKVRTLGATGAECP
jgi:pimeloyl-ACP methyl ester carboxylesterase